MNFRAAQPSSFWGACDDIARFELHLGSELLKSRKVKIDWTCSNRAPAWKRNFGFTKTRKQWTKSEHRSTHCFYQLIRRFEEFDIGRVDFVSSQLGSENCGA